MDWQDWQKEEDLTDLEVAEQLLLADPEGHGVSDRSIRNLRSGKPASLRTVLLFMRASTGRIQASTFDRWGIFHE